MPELSRFEGREHGGQAPLTKFSGIYEHVGIDSRVLGCSGAGF